VLVLVLVVVVVAGTARAEEDGPLARDAAEGPGREARSLRAPASDTLLGDPFNIIG